MHIVSGELRKAPFIKPGLGQDGQSVMFAVELSEVNKDYKTGEKTYTNYKVVLFAKGGQVDYYTNVLVENNFIVVSSEKLKIEVSDCGQYTKLSMENARLENAGYIAQGQQQQASHQSQQQGYAPQQQQGGYQQQQPQQQYAPQQQGHQQQQGGFGQNGGYAPQQ